MLLEKMTHPNDIVYFITGSISNRWGVAAPKSSGDKRIRLGKNELHELRGVQFKKRFSAKFIKFSVKFRSLNVKIRKTS